jgi:hypothetical protein
VTTTFINIRKFALAATLATAAFASLAHVTGDAHAEVRSQNNLKQLSLASINYSGDGDVDGRDFLAWQRSTSAGEVDGRDFLTWQRGASPAGGELDASDLAVWQSNYGVGY